MQNDISIEVPRDLSASLSGIGQRAQAAAVEAAQAGIEVALRAHFRALQQRPRQDGLNPVGFWDGVGGRSVAEQIHLSEPTGDSATVEIASPELAHKLSGGTIKAADYHKTYLTIPATDAAARALQGARSFNAKIAWVPHPDGGVRPALVAAGHYLAVTKRRGQTRQRHTQNPAAATAGAGDVLYWLVRQVTHRAQPDAMPTQDTLTDAAYEAAQDAVNDLIAGDAA